MQSHEFTVRFAPIYTAGVKRHFIRVDSFPHMNFNVLSGASPTYALSNILVPLFFLAGFLFSTLAHPLVAFCRAIHFTGFLLFE